MKIVQDFKYIVSFIAVLLFLTACGNQRDLKISEQGGGHSPSTQSLQHAIPDIGLPDDNPIGEVVNVVASQYTKDQWHQVTFEKNFNTIPVVIASIQNRKGRAHVRIKSVTTDTFEFKIEEWAYLDGQHPTENISFLAIPEGVHYSYDLQSVIIVTSMNITNSGTLISSEQLQSGLATINIVLSQVQTFNGSDPVVTRMSKNSEFLSVDIQEEERLGGYDSHLKNEHVGVVVFRPKTYHGGFSDYIKSVSGVTHRFTNVSTLASIDTETHSLFAQMQTKNGKDTSDIRFKNFGDGSGQYSIKVHEERSKDNEQRHTAEDVGLVILKKGLMY